MNIKMLNTINLDDVIIKKGGSGGGNTGGGGESGGGSNTQENDVTFYDYDGTILHSYTKKDFLALTEFPELPVQKGLICEGWNNNIDEAQSYVREYGFLQIGAIYVTDDGKTRLYISTAKGRMDIPLIFRQDVANGVIVDWGDGSSTQTFSNTGTVKTNHTYSKIGDYMISLEPTNNCTFQFGDGGTDNAFGYYSNVQRYLGMLKKVEIGNNIPKIGKNAFQQCRNLRSVTIPNNTSYINDYAFDGCVSLQTVVLPNTVTIIQQAFTNCYELQNVVMFKSYLSQLCFQGCLKLKHLVLSPKVSTVPGHSFSSTGLQNVIIPNIVRTIEKYAFRTTKFQNLVIPNNVMQIGEYAFDSCSLESVVISENIAQLSNYIFQKCKNLKSVTIPNSVTVIGDYAFYECSNLTSVNIGNSVTSIGRSAFYKCINLYNITIPKGVTNIGNSAFYSSSLGLIDFTQHESIPTLGSDVFTGVYGSFKIVVPDELYDEWIAATNWSNYASKIIKKSDYDAL